MSLIKLNRINKGGEILLNTDHILFAEVEARTTTVHMTGNLLFSVEESLETLQQKVLQTEAAGPTATAPHDARPPAPPRA